jgi:hypothetical protein
LAHSRMDIRAIFEERNKGREREAGIGIVKPEA